MLERSPSEKSKDDKKKRDKKPGMLSGLFRRKDKKTKVSDEDIDDILSNEKHSAESSRGSPVPEGPEEISRPDTQKAATVVPSAKESPNKLQKRSRSDTASSREGPVRSAASSREGSPRRAQGLNRLPSSSSAGASPGRLSEDDSARQNGRGRSDSLRRRSPESGHRQPAQPQELNREVIRPMDTEQQNVPTSQGKLGPMSTSTETRPDTIRMVERQADVNAGPAIAAGQHPRAMQSGAALGSVRQPEPMHADDSGARSTPPPTRPAPVVEERLSESPVQVGRPSDGLSGSPAATSMNSSGGTAEETSDSPSSKGAATPPAALSSSPEMGDGHGGPDTHPAINRSKTDQNELERTQTPSPSTTNTTATTTTNGTASTPTWSDASLRTYLDNDKDIRDLLIVVHDRSGVVPAGPDHPVVGSLFKEENARLAEMTSVCISPNHFLSSVLCAPAGQEPTILVHALYHLTRILDAYANTI